MFYLAKILRYTADVTIPFSSLGTSTKSTLLLCWFVMDYHAHSGHCDVRGDGRKREEIEVYVEMNESQ